MLFEYDYFTNTRGHTWKRYEGEIDIFAYSQDYCNGPVCTACGYYFCHHCTGGVALEDCTSVLEVSTLEQAGEMPSTVLGSEGTKPIPAAT